MEIKLHGVTLPITGGFPGYLPEGVHTLSEESQAALARASEKGAAITARHTKRAS